MMRQAISLVFVLLLSGLVTPAHAPASAMKLDFEPFSAQSYDGRPIEGELAYLEVPETRTDSDRAARRARTIEIAVLRLPSAAANPGRPIVWLSGGPGSSGIDSVRSFQYDAFMALRQVADVIAIDQRGTGRSRPSLECDDQIDPPLDERLTLEAYREAFREPLQKCQRRWERKKVDPAGYTSVESADDLEALREALGVDQIDLWAGSYGTHLALAAMRRHPDTIGRAVLMGVEGPDHTIKLPSRVNGVLRKLSKQVARSPVVGSHVPDMMGLIEDLMQRYAANPQLVTIDDPEGRGTIQVAVDDFLVLAAVAVAMGDRRDMQELPAVLAELDGGRISDATALAAWAVRRQSVQLLMRWTMDCASGVSEKRWKKVLRQEDRFVLGRALDLPIPEVCDVIDVPDLGDDYRAKLQSDVPTLIVSGDLDGRTPPANAKEIAKGFSDVRQLKIVRGSHDDLFTSHPDLVAAIVEFLRGDAQTIRKVVLDPIDFDPVGP